MTHSFFPSWSNTSHHMQVKLVTWFHPSSFQQTEANHPHFSVSLSLTLQQQQHSKFINFFKSPKTQEFVTFFNLYTMLLKPLSHETESNTEASEKYHFTIHLKLHMPLHNNHHSHHLRTNEKTCKPNWDKFVYCSNTQKPSINTTYSWLKHSSTTTQKFLELSKRGFKSSNPKFWSCVRGAFRKVQ
jgi:hypothetical protein